MAAEINQEAVRQLGWVCVAVLTIAPIANTLLATVISGVQALGRGARRIQALDEAKKRVEFWQSCFDLLGKPITASDEGFQHRMKADLIKAADVLDERLAPKMEEIRPFVTSSAFRRFRKSLPWWRRLLLTYRPPTEAAKRARFKFLWLLTAELMFCGLAVLSMRAYNHLWDDLAKPLPPLTAPAAPQPASKPAEPQAKGKQSVTVPTASQSDGPVFQKPVLPASNRNLVTDQLQSSANFSTTQIYEKVPYPEPEEWGLLASFGQILSTTASLSYPSIISISVSLAELTFAVGAVPTLIMWWRMRKIEISPKVYRSLREAKKRKKRRQTSGSEADGLEET